MNNIFENKTVLVTGGTGSFGKEFIKNILKLNPKKVIVYSRDEFKQFVMSNMPEFSPYKNIISYVIGDVRDKTRLTQAMPGVDYVVHAAALKQVPSCEYNPFEAVKTNVLGAENVIEAASENKVEKVIALSTDKACAPVNLYGATKLCSDKLFIAANGSSTTKFSIVRYGNVAGSRGSVIPFFQNIIDKGERKLPITDPRMTRFWISLKEGVQLVIKALEESHGGEIYISKIPSFKITDLAQAMLPGCKMPEVGIREGEKLHEVMILAEDSARVYEYEKNYIIYPNYNWWHDENIISGGKPVEAGFIYSSGTNVNWLSVEDIKTKLLTDLKHPK